MRMTLAIVPLNLAPCVAWRYDQNTPLRLQGKPEHGLGVKGPGQSCALAETRNRGAEMQGNSLVIFQSIDVMKLLMIHERASTVVRIADV